MPPASPPPAARRGDADGRDADGRDDDGRDDDGRDDDGRDDAVFAFRSALDAHLLAGCSMEQAARQLLPPPPAARADPAAPLLRALAANAALRSDSAAVAALLHAFYRARRRAPSPPSARPPRVTLAHVASLVLSARNIVALVGAGVSVSSGIPDFRSAGGVYDAVMRRFDLCDPQQIFCLEEFRHDPSMFFQFASHIMPQPHVRPSPTHFFLAELQRTNQLLRLYSQNIDGLERAAGVSKGRTVLCHGSFLTATCIRSSCARRVPGSAIARDVRRARVPRCPACRRGVLKPDIVFFGERLPDRVGSSIAADVSRADLLLVLGTSLRVAPVARIPGFFDSKVPRVLINREPVPARFDVELLGDCDHVVACLRKELGWPHSSDSASAPEADQVTYRFEPPNRFVFEMQPPAQQSDAQDSALSDEHSGEHSCDDESDSRIDEHSESRSHLGHAHLD
ncbi:Sirtuin [Gracilaria domingensis]|nr:Sirtuin [Gracilaria domingensis]